MLKKLLGLSVITLMSMVGLQAEEASETQGLLIAHHCGDHSQDCDCCEEEEEDKECEVVRDLIEAPTLLACDCCGGGCRERKERKNR